MDSKVDKDFSQTLQEVILQATDKNIAAHCDNVCIFPPASCENKRMHIYLRSLNVTRKLTAIKRVQNGETEAVVARELEIPISTLSNWLQSPESIIYEGEMLTQLLQLCVSTEEDNTSTSSSAASMPRDNARNTACDRMPETCKISSRLMSPEQKLEAVKRVQNGETKASVAKSIRVPESTLRGWCKSEQKLRSRIRMRSNDEQAGPSSGDNGTPSSAEEENMVPIKRARLG